MKFALTALVALLSMGSAMAGSEYFNCRYTQHSIINSEEKVISDFSSSIDRNGNSDIITRVERITIVAELENYSKIKLKLIDTTDSVKRSRTVAANESVTITLPSAYGQTRDGRMYKGVTLSCRMIAK